MGDLEQDLARQLNEGQAKYTYFLLAAAASGIALAVQRTGGEPLRWSMIPLGLSVACWGASFFAGCRNRQYYASTIHANAALIQVRKGNHPEVGLNPNNIATAVPYITKAMEDNSRVATRWAHIQFYSLIAGAVLFVAWHILTMALKT
jgi:hypothetical protein